MAFKFAVEIERCRQTVTNGSDLFASTTACCNSVQLVIARRRGNILEKLKSEHPNEFPEPAISCGIDPND
jgi:hypothetical protein